MHNWELFYGQYAGGKYFQKWPSMDVSCAIATKILGCEHEVTLATSYPTFTHMKLHNQNWDKLYVNNWQQQLGPCLIHFHHLLQYKDQVLNYKFELVQQKGH